MGLTGIAQIGQDAAIVTLASGTGRQKQSAPVTNE
jgi:hypothetical protein